MGLPAKSKKAAFSFLYADLDLTAEDEAVIREMAMIATDSEQSDRYPTVAALARKIGISTEQLGILKRTPEYQMALKSAIRLATAEGAAAAVGRMSEIARSKRDDSVAAFNALVKVAGVEENTKPGVMIQNNVTTLEARLASRLEQRVSGTVIDVTPE